MPSLSIHGYVDLGGYLGGDPKSKLQEKEEVDTYKCTGIERVYPRTLNICYFPTSGVLSLSIHGYIYLGEYLAGDPKPDLLLLEEDEEDTCECTGIGRGP